jgi:hypothetical protein
VRHGGKPPGSARHGPPTRKCQTSAATILVQWGAPPRARRIRPLQLARHRAHRAHLHHVFQARLVPCPMRLGPHLLSHIPPYQADQRDPQEYRWDRGRKGELKQALNPAEDTTDGTHQAVRTNCGDLRNMVMRTRIADYSTVGRVRYSEIIGCAVAGSLGILVLDALYLRPGMYYIDDSTEPLRSVAMHSLMERFWSDTFFRPLEYLVLATANNIYLPLYLGVSLLCVVGATILSALACERLFERQLPKAAWCVLGIANPLLFYLVTAPGTVSQCLCNILFAGALLAFVSELKRLLGQPHSERHTDRLAVFVNLMAASLFFTKETAVAAAVLLPAATALVRLKTRRLSRNFMLSLLLPIGAAAIWILIKLQLPFSIYSKPGHYSLKLNLITWAENFIATLAFPVTPLPSSFIGFDLLRSLWAATALGSVIIFIGLLLRESLRDSKIVLSLLVIVGSCAPMILIHSSELYSTMIAPFAVAIIVLCGVSKMRRSIFAYGLLLYTAAVVNGIVYSFGTDVNLLGLQRLKYSIYSKYPQQNVICPITTTGHIAWDGAAFICEP